MPLFTGFLRTLILMGALQGLILSFLLFFSHRNRQSNRFLAGLIFLMALASLYLYLQDEKWIDSSRILLILSYVIPMVVVMPLGPLIYFYIRSSTDPAFTFSAKYRIHFYSVIIDLVPPLTTCIYIAGLLFGWIRKNDRPWGDFIDDYNVYSDIPRWLSLTVYLWASGRYLKTLKAKDISGTNRQAGRLKWQSQFIRLFIFFQLIWLAYLIPYIIPRYRYRLLDAVGWYPIYIPISILIYWLGIRGYLVSDANLFPFNRANRIALTEDLVQKTILALRRAMEADKLFMNPELNLSQLTKHTRTSQKIISAVLNQHMHKSFNEFVNEYRIQAIKERLLRPTDNNLTIAGVAYECGFNSQPTFQRAFKRIVGLSPSEFLSKNA